MSGSSEQIATAYHEAGHAVIALALGRDVHRVSIKPNLVRLGHCQTKKSSFRPSHDVVQADILILLAGLAAEARHTGVYNWDAAGRDLDDVRRLTRMRGSGERRVERLERRMLAKAEHLLDQPGMWLAAQQIAEALLHHETISGRAARHLFDRAVRDANGQQSDQRC